MRFFLPVPNAMPQISVSADINNQSKWFSFPKFKLCKPYCVDNFMQSTQRDWMSVADRKKTDFDPDLVYQIDASAVNKAPQKTPNKYIYKYWSEGVTWCYCHKTRCD